MCIAPDQTPQLPTQDQKMETLKEVIETDLARGALKHLLENLEKRIISVADATYLINGRLQNIIKEVV